MVLFSDFMEYVEMHHIAWSHHRENS